MESIAQIRICGVGEFVAIAKVASEMNRILGEYEVVASELLPYPTSASQGTTGFDPSALVDEVYRDGCAGEEADVIGILTALPLSGARVFICNDRRIVVVSDFGLQMPPDPTERFVISLLSALIRIELGFTEVEHKSEGCLFDTGGATRSISVDLCYGCQSILGGASRRMRSWLQRAEQVFRGDAHHVILMHGIATFATWFDKVTPVLDSKGIDSKRVDYGYFGLSKLLRNTRYAQYAIDRLYNAYRRSREERPTGDISVISHSFGSLVIAQALRQYSEIKLTNLIISGGIIPADYDWSGLLKSDRIRRISNECGDSDVWPVLAAKLIPNAGDSGTLFFSEDDRTIVNRRYKDAGHAALLTAEHCKQLWIPFLLEVTYNPPRTDVAPSILVQALGSLSPNTVRLITIIIGIIIVVGMFYGLWCMFGFCTPASH